MSSKTLLLVEDNPDDELLTIEALEENRIGNDLVVARDGQEALDYVFGNGKYEGRDTSDQPAAILLDLNLPKVDGLEVLKRIRADAKTSLIPVVILTTSNQDEDRLKGYELGANSYVRKPVDFDEFLKATAQLGLYWLVLNQVPPKK